MGKVLVNELVKKFNTHSSAAIQHVSFTVEEGQVISLLGPSGCGKTTTLRCIAGLEHPDRGEIWLGGNKITEGSRHLVPPERRGMGMVFQSYSIWPHMTVGQNIGLGLQAKKMNRTDISRKVDEVLALVRLPGFGSRPATDLSGGQQQRVALARSLALEPQVLLFDEPLSNLDAKLREDMRSELRDLLRRLGITSIYVTHDQAEAFVISDRIFVMRDGQIVQSGEPKEIYTSPANRFVAEFIGVANMLSGVVRENEGDQLTVALTDTQIVRAVGRAAIGSRVDLCVRPEVIQISPRGEGKAPHNSVEGKVSRRLYLGQAIEYRVALDSTSIRVNTNPSVWFDVGQPVWMTLPAKDILVLGVEKQS